MMTKITTYAVTVFAATLLLSCKGKAEQKNETITEQTETGKGQGKEFTSAYVCPMHCEGSGSDNEGTCPTCGMAYVALTEHTKDRHKH